MCEKYFYGGFFFTQIKSKLWPNSPKNFAYMLKLWKYQPKHDCVNTFTNTLSPCLLFLRLQQMTQATSSRWSAATTEIATPALLRKNTPSATVIQIAITRVLSPRAIPASPSSERSIRKNLGPGKHGNQDEPKWRRPTTVSQQRTAHHFGAMPTPSSRSVMIYLTLANQRSHRYYVQQVQLLVHTKTKLRHSSQVRVQQAFNQ